jgi:nucleoside-diphosphate-sugar epimerase
MKVLVFGGNRYIGLHLIFELARQGHEVTVMNSHAAAMPEGTRRLHGDRHQPGVLEEVLGLLRDEFDAVFDNTAYTPDHLAKTVALFRGRVKHFIFTSSVAVYRWAKTLPVREDAEVTDKPETEYYGTYGSDKVLCETLLRKEYRENRLPYTVLRVGHSLGPMSPAVTREPGTFKRLEEGRPLLLAGKTESVVHFVHIQDAARAMCAVLGNDRAIGHTYNVAGSDYCSISSYMQLLAETVGVEPNIINLPPSLPAGMRSPIVHWLEARHGSMIFSIEKARTELGWEPQFNLRTGLADSYRWFKEEGRDRYQFDFSVDEAILAELDRRGPEAVKEGSDGIRIFQS